MTATEIIRVLIRRWWLVVAGALIAGLVAAGLCVVWPRSYEAEATLLVTKLRPSMSLDTRFQTASEENIVNLSIQEEQVRRQTLLGLADSPRVASLALERLGDALAPDERSVAALTDMVDADTVGNLIVFRARADTPARAAAVINAWVQAYATYVNRLYSTPSPTAQQMQVQLASAKATYEQSESDLTAFVGASREAELARQVEQKEQVLANLQAGQVAAAQRQVNELLARANRNDALLRDARSLQADLEAAPAGSAPGAGEQLALATLQAGALAQTAFFSTSVELALPAPAGGPATAGEALAQLDRLARTLEADGGLIRAEIARRSAALLGGQDLVAGAAGAETVAALQSQIAALQAELEHETWKRQALEDARDVARDTYLTISRKANEVQLASDVTGTEVQVTGPAAEPEEAASPRMLVSVVLAMAAGGLAGLMAAFLVEFWPKSSQRAPGDAQAA